jgi:hypothetical protein
MERFPVLDHHDLGEPALNKFVERGEILVANFSWLHGSRIVARRRDHDVTGA